MADQPEATPAAAPSNKKFVVAILATGAIAGAAGAAVPLLLHKSEPAAAAETTPEVLSPHEPLTPDRAEFISFDELTVNLNDGRLNRFLRVKLALQVDKLQVDAVTKAVDTQKLVLRNWLISYLSDKDQDEIRGAAGQNMLRREIRDQFNALLFDDGYDRVYDILFEEFNVQ